MKTRLRHLSALTVSLWLGGLATLMLVTGCDPDPVTWNLEVVARTDSSVQVDLVGVNHVDKKDWDALAVDDYWREDNSFRKNWDRLTLQVVDRKITLVETTGAAATSAAPQVTGEGTDTLTIAMTHPIWKTWFARRAEGVEAIGRFPFGGADRPDPRKRWVPLYKQVWDTKKRTLTLEIQDGRIHIATPPSAKAAKIALKQGY